MRHRIPAILMVLFACSADAADLKKQPLREWVDNTGTHRIKARLLKADQKSQSVQLRLDSGKEVTFAVRRLSVADRRYLNSQVTSPESSSQTTAPRNIAGIKWIDTLSQASRIALAGKSPKDDKPIMCFRALGDLSGFM